MFQVLAHAPASPLPRSAGILPLAALLHATAFSGLVAAQYWHVEDVAPPVVVERFVQVILPDFTPRGPQNEPPAAQPAAAAPAEARQPQPAVVTPATAPPVVQPETLPTSVPGPATGPEIEGGPFVPAGPIGPPSSGGGDCLVDCATTPGGGGGEGDGPVHVVAGITPPQLLDRVLPVYPERARQARRSGRVLVEAVIDRDGRVLDAQVASPRLGFGLEESALAAVRRWRFSPALRGSQPVAVYFRLTVDFDLR